MQIFSSPLSNSMFFEIMTTDLVMRTSDHFTGFYTGKMQNMGEKELTKNFARF